MWVGKKWMEIYLKHPVRNCNSTVSLLERINDNTRSFHGSIFPTTSSLFIQASSIQRKDLH